MHGCHLVSCVDEGMDGEAVNLAYATISGPDCLKDVISRYGVRLKIYQAIKDALFTEVFYCFHNFCKDHMCI